MLHRHFKLNRIFFLLGLSLLITAVIIAQMFRLQIIQHKNFAAKAEEGHLGYSEVDARRGEILIRDYHSGEIFRLATNTSFPLLFADPTLIKDPAYVTDKLVPLIFDLETAREEDRERMRHLKQLGETNLAEIVPRTEEELQKNFKDELFAKLSQKTRQRIVLYKSPSEEMLSFLEKNRLSGIEATSTEIVAYPPQIGDQDYAARILSPIIDIPFERLSELLVGRNRYTVLRKKVSTKVEEAIRTLIKEDKEAGRDSFTGINFQEQAYRYYPEGKLAAQVIGFTSDRGNGLYGIEKSFDTALRGKKGIFKTRLDATGQQVIVGDDLIIQPAINGDSVTLTLDRSVQMEIERMLAERVRAAKADSGLVIIMEPTTGRIIALAHHPTFDPNNFGEALDTEDISLTEEQIKQSVLTVGAEETEDAIHWLYLDADSNYRIQVFKNIMENGRTIFSKFKNLIGAATYRNRAVSDIFEPGSVFKVIAMSIALDDGDVTPQTTYNDTGPVKADEFEIHNALGEYYGVVDMTTVITKSLNTGMSFVARKMGRELFYRYLKKFGFGEPTEIEFEDEADGKIKEASSWAESELVTYAFGQGLAVTPIQFVAAISTIANKGILMQPHIVLRTETGDGKITEYEPEKIRRVISEKAAATIAAMMVAAVENTKTRAAAVEGYRVAGKTGTAQTYKHGKPLTGPGTTIASYAGFGPLNNPKFVILVKIDRPRSSIWADAVSAPLFADIAEFLFKYYNIPPDV